MWQGIRYRAAQAVTLALLAALIATCAVFAPVYQRAVEQTVVDVLLQQSTVANRGLSLRSAAPSGAFAGDAPAREPSELLGYVPDTLRGYYGEPIASRTAQVNQPLGAPNPSAGVLEYRAGQCGHVRAISGTCPQDVDQVMISLADTHTFGYQLGSVITVPTIDRPKKGPVDVNLTVVGVYTQPADDPYWFGTRLDGRSGTEPAQDDSGGNGPSHPLHDVWLTPQTTLVDPARPSLPETTTLVDLPLRTSKVDLDDLATIQSGLRQLRTSVSKSGSELPVAFATQFPSIATDVAHQRSQARTIVPVLVAQLGLLAVVVLWLVLGAAIEQRRPDVAIAYLRGRSRGNTRRRLVTELSTVTLVGVPFGILVAFLLGWLARTAVLPGDAAFEVTPSMVLAAALSVVVVVATAAAAAWRVTREDLADLLRRVPPRRTGWAIGIGEALLASAAAILVVAFATGGLSGPFALVAPALLALVVGMVLAYAVGPLAAGAGRRLLARGRTTLGVAVLDTARSATTRRTLAIVTVAAALLAFCVDAVAVGQRNREYAAEQQAGAPLVAEVSGIDLGAILAALKTVDPDSRQVTPVLRTRPPGQDTTVTLGVQPAAFRRVALWVGGVPRLPLTALAPPQADPISFTGATLGFSLSTAGMSGVDSGDVGLRLRVLDLHTLEVFRLDAGTIPQTERSDVPVSVDVPCARSCALIGIEVLTLPGNSARGSFVLDHLTTGDGTAVPIGPANRWVPLHDSKAGQITPVSTTPDQLRLSVQTSGLSVTSLDQAWLPSRIGTVVSGDGRTPATRASTVELTGIDGEERTGRVVGRLPRIPGSPPRTSLVDLDTLTRGSTPSTDSQLEVWFRHDSPRELAAVRAALRKQGLSIDATRRLSDDRRQLNRSAAAWSLQLGYVAGLVGLLVGLLVVIVLTVSRWRQRARDLAALRMSGFGDARIRRVAALSQVTPVVVAAVVGTASGLVGAQLALPDVPFFTRPPAVSTLDLAPAWLLVLAVALVGLLVLGTTAWLAGRALARRARLERLRETV